MDILNDKIFENKIAYDEFTGSDRYDLKEKSFDEQTMEFWRSRNFYTQMMDVWGEVDKARNMYAAWLDADEGSKKKKLASFMKEMRFVRECIDVVKNNNDFEDKVKETFRIAEWELYDFFFWDNEFGNTIETVTRWFDQWCFNINCDLIA